MPKVPRDISGKQLCRLLGSYGYRIIRQTGNHIRLTSNFMGYEHSITIPEHDVIKIGTMSKILKDVADYLEVQKQELLKDLMD